MDDTPDPIAEIQCLIALALAEIDDAGQRDSEGLFLVRARVMLVALAVSAANAASRSDQSSPLR